jgi:DNA helicase HerA-like ATPase
MIFGVDAKTSSEVEWSTSKLANPHVAIFGDSGMGKSTLLRRFAKAMEQSGHPRFRMHIADGHGDMEIDGESAVRFHESADFGFNPLELNPDPEFGGVRKRIQSLIAAMNRTSVRLGHRQERLLTKLLAGLYAQLGFIADVPSTWSQDIAAGKLYPTLTDAIEYGKDRIKAMYLGTNQKALSAFAEVNRAAKQLRAKESALTKSDDVTAIARLEREVDSLREKAIDSYREAVSYVHSGEELDDLLEFDGQQETMKSVVDRLENLYAIGIYKSTPPPLDPRCRIWRYIITSLSQEEKKLFVITRLEAIFTRAVQRGLVDEVLDVVVLDEAHNYQDKDEDYIVNKMVREGRKFGIAMVFASQSPTDFADVLIANLGTKVTLGLDTNYWPMALRKLGLTEASQKFIIPRKRVIVQMKLAGQAQVGAYHVILRQ